VASVTAFIAAVEIVTSTTSFVICYNGIGWNCSLRFSVSRWLLLMYITFIVKL